MDSSQAPGLIASLFYLALAVFYIASWWKVYAKAGQPGWSAIIPIYNVYILVKIAGRPWWWLLLLFIPLLNVIIAFVIYLDVAKKFGKGVGFALGMLFLGIIFFPILGFGSAQYRG